MSDRKKRHGWWTISGEELIAVLHRVADGEDPEIAYAELYANTERVEPWLCDNFTSPVTCLTAGAGVSRCGYCAAQERGEVQP